MKEPKSYSLGLVSALGLSIGLAGVSVLGQSGADSVEAHVAAARTAAGQQHTAVFDTLCAAPAPTPAPQQAQPPQTQPQGPPERSRWHAEPAKVFDNLYYLGQSEYSAWAVTTSDGIIVVDALFDYSVEDEIVNGLTKLGLDPTNIKYVLVSHGHSDHVGGARLLQDRFGARVIMSAADWDLIGRNTQSWPKPKRDMVATDGQRLTLGDTTLTLYLTPGHTPGTISTLIPVRDQGRPHLAAEWGGTGFNFTITPDKPRQFWFETYANSADHFRDAVTRAGADVLIANHPNQDGTKRKLAALEKRKPGDANPYVIGNDSVRRYLTMVGECAKAGLLRLQVAQGGSDPNAAPNPYREDEGWAKLAQGRKWGAAVGVDIDRDGKSVWVFDRCATADDCSGSNLAPIQKFDASGRLVASFGAGMFNYPHGLFVDRDGNVWVSDGRGKNGKGHTVMKFSPAGALVMTLGNPGVPGDGPDTFNAPSDILIAPNGDIFVADGHGGDTNARIVKLSKDGRFIKAWGKKGSAPGEFDTPHGLAMDSAGRLFVADRSNSRIQVFNQDGQFLAEWRQFGRPSGVFVDKKDVIYAADSTSTDQINPGYTQGIRIGSVKDGKVTAFIPWAETNTLEGVAADDQGNVYGGYTNTLNFRRFVKK